MDDTLGGSANISTDLVDVGSAGNIYSSGGNEVQDGSWINIQFFSTQNGDAGNT